MKGEGTKDIQREREREIEKKTRMRRSKTEKRCIHFKFLFDPPCPLFTLHQIIVILQQHLAVLSRFRAVGFWEPFRFFQHLLPCSKVLRTRNEESRQQPGGNQDRLTCCSSLACSKSEFSVARELGKHMLYNVKSVDTFLSPVFQTFLCSPRDDCIAA